MPFKLNSLDAGFAAAFNKILSQKRESAADVRAAVLEILAAVRARGDRALIDYTKRFDRFDLKADTLRVTAAQVERGLSAVSKKERGALDFAADRIRDFHRRQKPADISYTDDAGVRLGLRWNAVQAAGIYVPGGTASYPSSVLMNAIPAKTAGVERIVMTVPTPDGVLNPLVLAAAKIAGVNEIYRVGGAQAIAALAYGTDSIRPVDVVVGPGNAYVAAAKREVFGAVGIDMIAGPSEIVVVADGANNPDWIAADLLAQAEHDESAQSVLITDHAGFAEKVETAIAAELKNLSRAAAAGKSWQTFGAIIQVRDFDEVAGLVNQLAPEHLELAIEDPEALAAKIRNAGAIFLGRYTPEAVGDYVAGPNHVLPTARTARFSSGLSVYDFMKRTSMIGCDRNALKAIGPQAVILGLAEGLDAHARSVSLRLQSDEDDD